MFAHGDEPRGVLVTADSVPSGEDSNAIVQEVEVLHPALCSSFNSGGHSLHEFKKEFLRVAVVAVFQQELVELLIEVTGVSVEVKQLVYLLDEFLSEFFVHTFYCCKLLLLSGEQMQNIQNWQQCKEKSQQKLQKNKHAIIYPHFRALQFVPQRLIITP